MNLVSPIDPAMAGVVWTKTLQEEIAERPRLAGDESADLVVVGGGYCGLSIALHAAKAGLKVILLEAGTVGDGASGRNGGFVVPHFPGGITPSRVAELIGRRKGEALAELVVGGADVVFNQIREYQIRCHAEQTGWVQPAHSAKSLAAIRPVHDEWRALGAKVRWLEPEEITRMTGAPGYRGGWINPSGGTVNPYSLALGLARIATNLGVRIFEHSPAEGFATEAGGVVVQVGRHRVRGRKTIVATNGYSGTALPAIQRSVIPIGLFHAATRRLSAALLKTILPSRVCFTDLRKAGGFARLDPENRLLAGGVTFALGDAAAYGFAHARRRIATLFPAIDPAEIQLETYWEGYCAVTPSYLPHVQVLGEGFLSIGGFSTRGLNLAQNVGRLLGELAAERRTLDDIPLEVRDTRRDIPLWSLKARAARLIFPVYQAKDRLHLS